MAKRGLCLLLALVTLLSLSVPAFAEEEAVTTDESVVTEEPVIEPEELEAQEAEPVPAAWSGPCGDGVTYTLTDDGLLTVTGNGEIRYGAFAAQGDIITAIIHEGVTGIGEYAFLNCRSLTSVTIPASVTSIGSYAFSGCESLTNLTIPGSVTSIGGFTFAGCTLLTSVTIPASVTSIGQEAFVGCSSLKAIDVEPGNASYRSIGGVLFNAAGTELICLPGSFSGVYNIPMGVTSIGAYAFGGCYSLTGVTIPDGVTSIGDGAFSGCYSLTSVTIPSSVTSIGRWAFADTPWLAAQGDFAIVNDILLAYQGSAANVTIPSGVTTIGAGAFEYCSSLTSVTIPASVTSIEAYAFCGCTSLTDVTIPSSVTSIGESAFWECTSLTDITIPGSVTTIGVGAFSDCYSLTSVTIENGVTTIGDGAFARCPFSSVTIPDSVTSIGALAFNFCTALTSVTLPVSVTSIGEGAFAQCESLTSVTVLNPNCTIVDQGGIGMSLGVPGQTVIHGYDGSTAQAYANQYGYKFESFGLVPVPDPTLAAPTVTISRAAAGIQVSWNAIAGSPRYMVYYKENGGGWKQIGTTTSTTYTRAAKYLKSGATYQFTVRCCANDKKTLLSPYKASNSLKYTATLAAPTVTISSVSAGIKVSWNAVTGSPRYMVYYRENGGSWVKIGTTTATTYTRKAAQLKDGVNYQFTVRCCDNDRKTTLSGYKASNSLRYTSQLAPPTVKIAKAAGGIKVSWNKIAGSPRYMVYYKENGGSWTKIGTTTSTTYTRAAKYLKSGATYQFTVRCCANDKKTLLGPYKASNSLKYTK